MVKDIRVHLLRIYVECILSKSSSILTIDIVGSIVCSSLSRSHNQKWVLP